MRNVLLSGIALLAAGWAASASAAPIISYTITDNGSSVASGNDGGAGVLNFVTSSSHFSNISFNASGTPTPSLGTNSLDVKGSGQGGTLVIKITETGLTSFNGTFMNTLTANTLQAGNQFQSISVENYLDASNAAYGTGIHLLSDTYTTKSSFSDGPLALAENFTSPFSETTVYTIVFNNGSSGGTVSASSQITANTPEPASLAVLGTSLMGMGLVRRFRRKS